MVGARRAHPGRTRGRPGWHRPERGDSHACQRAACHRVHLQWFSSGYLLVLAVAMLPMGLLGDRFGRKKVMLFVPATVRRRFCGLRLCALGECVHRRAFRPRTGRGRHHRDGALRADGAVHAGRATASGGHLGRRQLSGAADWSHTGRLAVDPLLVGLGISHERSRGAHRVARGVGARAGVTRSGSSRTGPGRHRHLGRWTGGRDVWFNRGRPQWLVRRERVGPDRRRSCCC